MIWCVQVVIVQKLFQNHHDGLQILVLDAQAVDVLDAADAETHFRNLALRVHVPVKLVLNLLVFECYINTQISHRGINFQLLLG